VPSVGGAMSTAETLQASLIEELTAIVGREGILAGDTLKVRSAGWLKATATEAFALVRPRSTQEVARVMSVCHRRRQKVVVQGGMTGLVDGALAQPDELALSLERLNRIEEIDTTERIAVLEAGVTIQRAQESAAERGLLFAADWAARGTATVGGGVATNGGGLNVIRYGMMREQVLGLEVVLADGTVLSSMNRMLKNNTGYDLKQLFIGSEGTLGIVTRAVIRLRPKPSTENTALLASPGMREVSKLLALMDTQLSGDLSAFEVMWPSFYELMTTASSRQPPLPLGAPLYVLAESRGAAPGSDESRFQAVLERASELGLITDAVIAASKSQRDALWAIREDIPGLSQHLRPMIVYDVSLPIQSMEAYLKRVMTAVEERFPAGRGAAFGHIGDCNLHLCFGLGNDDERHRSDLSALVYDALVSFGGSISAEHGIGFEKVEYLDRSRSPVEIGYMRGIKQLFDPSGILNAGRVIPAARDQRV
jgi:FAD/FMN-containing dehydrogenase